MFNLETVPPGEITTRIRDYEILHQQEYNRPADFSYVYTHMKRAISALAQGLKIDKIGIMYWLHDKKQEHFHEIEPSHLSWYTAVKERWIREFIMATPPSSYTPIDRYRIISLLLREDLSSWFPDQTSVKTLLLSRLTN
ncbi:MAG: hypothetical protein J1F12_08895 [Muribaculaceae bacterium]|nr:hypothetical protein [Muribaculaceae bacterium]